MITRFRFALCFIILHSSFIHSALAQGTAFTYQGRLSDNGGPVNGSYDFGFQLFDAAAAGASQGAQIVTNGISVSDGLFTVTLDFGFSPFSAGDPRWLEIKVRTNNAGTYGLIDPRLPVTATPYAVTAGNVVSGGLAAGTYSNALTLDNPANVVSGVFTGNGANVTNVNAATLGGLSSANFWNTNGNAGANPTNGAFLGTTDNLPLEIKVNGERGLRIEPNGISPNVIGGYSGNVVSNGLVGAFIGGGGDSFSPNRVWGDFASVPGGYGNLASGLISTAMGFDTTASGFVSTAMGLQTTASSNYSTAMGHFTLASGEASTALGIQTVASGSGSIAMGIGTTASGNDSTAMGVGAIASGDGSTAMGSYSLASNDFATAMGYQTTASGRYSTAMGSDTTASGLISTAMGVATVASGDFSTAMGYLAQATNRGTFVWADSASNTRFTSTSSNQFLIRAAGGVGIGTGNPASALDVESPDGVSVALRLVSGGSWPLIINQSPVSLFSITNGGQARLAITPGGFVGIGTTSPEAPFHVTEGSAGSVTASANAIAVFERAGAGYVSVLTPAASDSGLLFGNPNNPADGGILFNANEPRGLEFRAGGNSVKMVIAADGNVGVGTTAPEAPIHVAEGSAGTVTASANAIAVFERAGAGYVSVLTPAASESGILFGSPNNAADGGVLFNANAPRGLEFRAGGNSVKMVIAADGNVGIGNTNPTNKLMVINARCDGSSWINASDRNLKQGFAVVNPQEILAKVAALPIQSWSYKAQPEQKHVGPVAQDFHAAFALGQDDTTIATVDADGVALAAIQGLNQKLDEKESRIRELEKRLEKLEQLLNRNSHDRHE